MAPATSGHPIRFRSRWCSPRPPAWWRRWASTKAPERLRATPRTRQSRYLGEHELDAIRKVRLGPDVQWHEQLGDLADRTSLDLTTGMTLSAWVRPTSMTSDFRTVMLKETRARAGIRAVCHRRRVAPAGRLHQHRRVRHCGRGDVDPRAQHMDAPGHDLRRNGDADLCQRRARQNDQRPGSDPRRRPARSASAATACGESTSREQSTRSASITARSARQTFRQT